MSFDLSFFRPGGGDPIDDYARLASIDLDARPSLSPSESASIRGLLLAAHPGFGHSELPARENNSFQVFDEALALSMDIDSVLIEMNLSYLRSNSAEAFDVVAKIGSALAAAGYLCFDPQTGELVDWSKGSDAMRQRYDALPGQLANSLPLQFDNLQKSKPWWKFW
jgi:hypothetical protein